MDPKASPTEQPVAETPPATPEVATASPAPKKGFFASMMEMLGFGPKPETPATPAAPESPPMQSVDTSTPAGPPKTV